MLRPLRSGLQYGPARGREGIALGLAVVGVTQQEARMQGVVNGDKTAELLPTPVGQAVMGHAQVGKFGIAAMFRHRYGRQQGIFRARMLERAVAVPELVGDIADDLGMRTPGDLTVDLDVGNVSAFGAGAGRER